MREEPFVSIEAVAKAYPSSDGAIAAVEAVSVDIDRGEFVSLLGPSGCGKTTLMLMLAGLLRRDAGAIRIGGRPVDQPYTNVGIVFQDALLLDWRNVLDNLMLQAEIRGLDRAAMRARAVALLDMVGLAGFERRHPWELSGGMRQRVSICRALVHDPLLLLMDEPFGALDALTREQMNLDLQDIWLARRKTVLFITHSISEAVFLADRVLVMSPRPGRIAADIAVDLPRPRHPSLRETAQFGRYASRIRALFEEWGILREREHPAATLGTA
jgi:NitT/TauT family transport system ATP-binding protein